MYCDDIWNLSSDKIINILHDIITIYYTTKMTLRETLTCKINFHKILFAYTQSDSLCHTERLFLH